MKIEIKDRIRMYDKKVKNSDIVNSRKYIEKVISQVNRIKEETGITEFTQIRKKMLIEDKQIEDEYREIVNEIGVLQIQHTVSKYLKYNPHIIKELYEQRIGIPMTIKNNVFYRMEVDEATNTFMTDIMGELEQINALNLENVIGVINNFLKLSEKGLKEQYIKLLVHIGKILQQYELVEDYISRNNKKMAQVDMGELKISEGQEKLLTQTFQEQYLRTLSMEELCFLCTFYQNRIVKEQDNINTAKFMMDQLDLWEGSIYKRKIVEDEVIKRVLIKKMILDDINSVYNGKKDERKHIDTIRENQQEYFEVFGEILPFLQNDLAQEAKQTLPDLFYCRYQYEIKKVLLYKLLEMLKSTSKMNWGYIPQPEYEEGVNILIGIDFPGYNMPATFHINKNKFRNILHRMQEEYLKEYIGTEDFFVEGKRVPTILLYKVSPMQKKQIQQRAKQTNREQNGLLYHINTIIQGKRMHSTKKNILESENAFLPEEK